MTSREADAGGDGEVFDAERPFAVLRSAGRGAAQERRALRRQPRNWRRFMALPRSLQIEVGRADTGDSGSRACSRVEGRRPTAFTFACAPCKTPRRPISPNEQEVHIMTAIVDIIGREILDSRGNPTVEVDVVLEDGSLGRAAVPSGASTGAARGGGTARRRQDALSRQGRARRRSRAVNGEIFEALERHRCRAAGPDRPDDDRRSTARRTRAGSAPTPSSASRSPAPRRPPNSLDMPLYRYVGGTSARLLPVPMMNIINGGVHADNPIDFQEFMILPVGASTFAEGLRCGAEVFHTLQGGTEEGRPQHQCRRRGRLSRRTCRRRTPRSSS